MSRFFHRMTIPANKSGQAAPMEHHVAKRILATLLFVCSFSATAQNAAPSVSITNPISNTTYYGPATFSVTAEASDTDGSVSKVDFYDGANLIGSDSTAPFSLTWPDVAVGTYNLTATATDDQGAITTSTAVPFTVVAAPVPSVSISGPANNASFTAPASFTLTADATVSSGSISKVEYISGPNLVGTSTTPPYAIELTNIGAGTYTVTAKATGTLGGTAISTPITLVVNENKVPVVSLAVSSTVADAPATITLTASATDSDGTIAKVEFFDGATLLATVTQAPYSYAWSGVAAGSYALTARATDNLNVVAMSAVQAVTVKVPVATAQVFYIYSDQINAAREITNAGGVKVWQSDPEPFGANLPDENPAGLGKFTYNQRFPGQYFDRETGLHYNYHRDYDPQTGRYVQSDPIGLNGGINTYGYVGGNPISHTDRNGLQTSEPGNSTGVDFIKAVFPNWGKSGIPMSQCETGKCERTFTYSAPIPCDDDGTCPKERWAPPKTYDIDCILKMGVVGKGGGAVVGNLVVGQAPEVAGALGAGARTMAVVASGVEIFTGPLGIAFGAASGLYLISDHCECKK